MTFSSSTYLNAHINVVEVSSAEELLKIDSLDESPTHTLMSTPALSSRAQAWQADVSSHLSGLLGALNSPVSPSFTLSTLDISNFFDDLDLLFHVFQYSEDNPNGFLNVGISENSLMRDELANVRYFSPLMACQ